MKLILIDLDALTEKDGSFSPKTAAVFGRMRKKGNLIFFVTDMPGFYVRRNYSHYCSGAVCSGGRLAFTCCEMLVNDPLPEETAEMIIREAVRLGAGFAFSDMKYLYYEGSEEGFSCLQEKYGAGSLRHGMPEKKNFYSAYLFRADISRLELPSGFLVRQDGRFCSLTAGRDTRLHAAEKAAEKLGLTMKETVYVTAGYDDLLAEHAGETLNISRQGEGFGLTEEAAARRMGLI